MSPFGHPRGCRALAALVADPGGLGRLLRDTLFLTFF
jgi:hypothetical protein